MNKYFQKSEILVLWKHLVYIMFPFALPLTISFLLQLYSDQPTFYTKIRYNLFYVLILITSIISRPVEFCSSYDPWWRLLVAVVELFSAWEYSWDAIKRVEYLSGRRRKSPEGRLTNWLEATTVLRSYSANRPVVFVSVSVLRLMLL